MGRSGGVEGCVDRHRGPESESARAVDRTRTSPKTLIARAFGIRHDTKMRRGQGRCHGGDLRCHGECDEFTFNICWGGVYLNARAFLPMPRAADEAHIVNTISMNGFWASVGPDTPHTAYSAVKFAVKGFTEALVADFRMNAPHIKVSVVMPGHIGTSIRESSLKVQTGTNEDGLDTARITQICTRLTSMDRDRSKYSDVDIERMHAERARRFVSDATTGAAEAGRSS